MTKAENSKLAKSEPEVAYVYPQSPFQSKVELQLTGQQYGWLQNKMHYHLKLLLSDWLHLAKKSQDGKCDRCMAPLTADNINDSTVGTYVHLQCPVEQSGYVKSRIARYLKRHELA